MKKILIALCFLIAPLLIYVLFPNQGWKSYYKKKLYLPCAKITQESSSFFTQPGFAIDFGCGCGNDTAFLLNQGWTVWAIDGEPTATQILKKRNDISNHNTLFTHSEKFENIDWDNIPQTNLFLAINSLPFCRQENFNNIWNQITAKIESNGRFAGHFFDPSYQGFTDKERKSMTFLTKEEVIPLFKDFEIEYFNEKEEIGQSSTGRKIHSHIFEIIAKKL